MVSAEAADRRRYVIGIGVGEYDDPEMNLPAVANDVAAMTEWFASGQHQVRYERALPGLADNPTKTAITQTLRDWLDDRGSDDVVVIYLAAHGELQGRKAYVLGRDSPREKLAGRAIDGEELGAIIGQADPHNVLFIVDACVAGRLATSIQRAAEDEADETGTRDPHTSWANAVVCSTFGRDPAYDGRFREAFLKVVSEEQRTGSANRWISIDALMSGLNDELKELGVPQVAERKVWGTGPAELIPNPNFDTRELGGLISDEELAAHFDPMARGVSRGEKGSYFTGRHDELARIADWLREDGGGGLLVVTGSPGSGKSALVSRVVVLSDPELRANVSDLDALPEETVPPEGVIDAVIWCHNKRLDQIIDEIADKLGVAVPAGDQKGGQLLTAIGERGPTTIVVDALDEAAAGDARRVAAELIRPLASLAGVRVLVATRPHPVMRGAVDAGGEDEDLPTALGAGHRETRTRIVLDEAPNRVSDMAGYVAKRLQAIGVEDTPYSNDDDLAKVVARRIATAAGNSFLVAAVTARTLAVRPEPIDLGDPALELPSEVGAALAGYFDQFSDPGTVRDLLRPLASAEGAGLPWGAVWAPLAGALSRNDQDYDNAAITTVLDEASDLIVESTEDGEPVYRLFHEALAEYLRSSRTGGQQ